MPVHNYSAGARTRNVYNIALPDGTTAAYAAKTVAIAAPLLATDGFRNFRSQKTLHIVVDNDAMATSGAGAITVTVTLYGYNSSLGGHWAPLTIPVSVGSGDALSYKSVVTPVIAQNTTFRMHIPIEGVERIAASATISGGTVATGTYSIFLGVNSI